MPQPIPPFQPPHLLQTGFQFKFMPPQQFPQTYRQPSTSRFCVYTSDADQAWAERYARVLVLRWSAMISGIGMKQKYAKKTTKAVTQADPDINIVLPSLASMLGLMTSRGPLECQDTRFHRLP